MKKQLPHFCIDLHGNVLHAVILFKIQKLKKKPCCLIFASWPCDVYCPELTEPLCLSYSCGAVDVGYIPVNAMR